MQTTLIDSANLFRLVLFFDVDGNDEQGCDCDRRRIRPGRRYRIRRSQGEA
jgi:hypothetical protein